MRTATLLLLVVMLGLGTGTAAAATYFRGYSSPGETFSSGEGYGSAYDGACTYWVENDFSKPQSAYGLITFINTGGGWRDTKQGYGLLSRAPSSINWTKKLHCKNNSGATYQGGCYGFYNTYQCA